jgi:peptidoglycan/LPS O-acetylase OafA/YrhL
LASRCDGFAIGGLLALAMASHREDGATRRLANRLAILAMACVAYLVIVPALQGLRPFQVHKTPTGPVDLAIASALFAAVIGLVVCHQGRPALAPLRARWLVYLGTISYGIYLYHMAAQVLGDAAIARSGLPRGVSRLAVSPALTLASPWPRGSGSKSRSSGSRNHSNTGERASTRPSSPRP